MNPENASDIRQVQRFIFEQNLYLLTMFEKKIYSFNNSIMWENKQARQQHRQTNLHAGSIIDCDNFLSDAIKNLSKDLTKPFWNCVTKTDPRVVYRKQSSMEPVQMINAIAKIFNFFFCRLKNEHEDQSNFRINIVPYQFDKLVSECDKQQKQCNNPQLQALNETIYDLFQLLLALIQKQQTNLHQDIMEDDGNSNKKFVINILDAAKQMLNTYLERIDENFYNQMNIFNKTVISNFNDIINCKIGSCVLCLQPKLMTLPLLIHPLMISIYSFIKTQSDELQQREQHKVALKNTLNLSRSVSMSSQNQNNLNNSLVMEKQKQVAGNFIFDDILKTQSLSKITFINFDFYESQFNIDVAKYLCKNLMYVSFPLQSSSKFEDKQFEQINRLQDFKSERLLRKYFTGNLTQEQKLKLLQDYKLTSKQIKKNLYVYPLHSRILSQLKCLPSLHPFQSQFISFMMKRLIYSQIMQFNPSFIIVSYSQKLCIQKQTFVQIIKELTVLGNYKVVFYANLGKNYMFEQYYDQESKGLKFKNIEEKIFQQCQSNMKIFQPSPSRNQILDQNYSVNCDIFQKICIMVKICSGTHNLDRKSEPDCFIQKYKNYKALSYGTPLIDALMNEYSNMIKLKMRIADNHTLLKVLQNYFPTKSQTFQKLFQKTVSKFYSLLFKDVNKLLQIQSQSSNQNKKSKKHNQAIVQECSMQMTSQQNQRNRKNQQQIQEIKNQIIKKFNLKQRKQSWISFKFKKLLQISTQKLQLKFFAHLPRYKSLSKSRKQGYNLICLEFYVMIQRQSIPVEISPTTSKVYYSQQRYHPNALFYLTNHLLKISSTRFQTFCGVVTEQFDYKVSPRVQMHPVKFNGGPVLNQFQTFTQFNYFQSNSYIFMFWPKIYDSRKQMMITFLRQKYKSQQTKLIFCSSRKNPCIFNMIYNRNDDYIIPRHGCKSYEVQGTKTIYIFGGFYSDENNYLHFQTDITKLKYIDNGGEMPQISLQIIPKKFYFDFQQLQNNKNIKVITNLKNHIVRPKTQYQILQGEEQTNYKQQKTIFLIGGIGENFTRSYSMLGYMAHKVIINSNTGDLVSIRRINMNNLVPINTHQPIKLRVPMQSKVLSHAENRSINYVMSNSGRNGYSIYHNQVTYNAQTQRFQYENEYDFLDTEYRNYRQQVSLLRRSVVDLKPRFNIYAKSGKGKQFNTNYMLVTVQDKRRIIVSLQYLIPLDIKLIHSDLSPLVHLTGQSILSIDVSGSIVYALIKHPIYTIDQCVLATYDLSSLQRNLKQNKQIQLQLKQLYKFDEDLSHNVLIAANSATIVIVHGQKFCKNATITQIVLRRNKRKHIKIDTVYSNQHEGPNQISSKLQIKQIKKGPKNNYFNQIQQFYSLSAISVINGLSCSVMLNRNNGSIFCFSFKSIQKPRVVQKLEEQKGNSKSKFYISETIFFIVQKLDLSNDYLSWQPIFCRKCQMIIDQGNQANKMNQQPYNNLKFGVLSIKQQTIPKIKKRQKFKIISIAQYIKKQEKQPLKSMIASKNTFQIIAFYKQQCYSSIIQLGQTMNKMIFSPSGKRQSQYIKQLSTKPQKQYSVLIQKRMQDYNTGKEDKSYYNQTSSFNKLMNLNQDYSML